MSSVLLEQLIREVTSLRREVEALKTAEMPGGWRFISETVLTGTAASVTFSSIPGTYRTLVLMVQSKSDRAATSDSVQCQINGDTGNNYDAIYNYERGDDSRASGAALAGANIWIGYCEAATGGMADNWSPLVCQFPGYALTDRDKWLQSRSAVFGDASTAADLFMTWHAGRWQNTAAITSLLIKLNTGPNFISGSRFTLYGIP